MLCGSRAVGEQHALSDVDLQIVIREAWKQRAWLVEGGNHFDVWIRPVAEVRSHFYEEDRAVASMFATGRILIDGDGAMSQLVAEARIAMETPLPLLAESDVVTFRQAAWNFRNVFCASSRDPASAYLALHACVSIILYAASRLRCRYLGKVSKQLALLENDDPRLAKVVRRLLQRPSPTRRTLRDLDAMIESVFGSRDLQERGWCGTRVFLEPR